MLKKFRIVFNAVKDHFQNLEKQAGIGGAPVWALSLIQKTPEIGIGALSKSMAVHQSTASNIVKTLLDKKLIEMTRSVKDRRNVHITISSAGTDVLSKVTGPYEGVLINALGKLKSDSLGRLDLELQELISHFKNSKAASAGIPVTESTN